MSDSKDITDLEKEYQIDIFIHCCSKGFGMSILQEQLNKIKSSGLYDSCINIYIFIVGEAYKALDIFNEDKIKVMHLSLNAEDSEHVTMNEILTNHLKENRKILYIHTKGVSHPNDKKSRDWREFMEYALIENFDKCLPLLKDCDMVGCNLYIGSESENATPTHFSGNFWWANSSYMIKNSSRYAKTGYAYKYGYGYVKAAGVDPRTFPVVEFWAASYPDAKLKCIVNSGLNHYQSEFDRSIYKNLVDVSFKQFK